MDYLTSQNIRWAALTLLWTELGLTALFIMKQVVFVEDQVDKNVPTPLKVLGYEKKSLQIGAKFAISSAMMELKFKLYEVIMETVVIMFNVIPFIWNDLQLADSVLDFTPTFLNLELRKNISFGFCLSLINSFILTLQYEYYRTKLLHDHGFYRKSLKHFLVLALNQSLLDCLLNTLFYFVIALGIQIFDGWKINIILNYFILFVGYNLFSIIIIILIELLFWRVFQRETFIHIPAGDLKNKIDEICSWTGYPKNCVYIQIVPPWEIPNAYCFSFIGFTRIVFFSSIIKRVTGDNMGDLFQSYDETSLNVRELLGVFAHEVGHWTFFHMEVQFIHWSIISGSALFLFANFLRTQKLIFEAFGFIDLNESEFPLLPGLFISFIALRAGYRIKDVLLNILTRKMEYEADEFAVVQAFSKNLQEALIQGHIFRFPMSDQYYSLFFESHPTLLQRIENINFHTYGKK